MKSYFQTIACAIVISSLFGCSDNKDEVKVDTTELQKAVAAQEAEQFKAEGSSIQMEGEPAENPEPTTVSQNNFDLIEVEVVPESH